MKNFLKIMDIKMIEEKKRQNNIRLNEIAKEFIAIGKYYGDMITDKDTTEQKSIAYEFISELTCRISEQQLIQRIKQLKEKE